MICTGYGEGTQKDISIKERIYGDLQGIRGGSHWNPRLALSGFRVLGLGHGL